MSRHLDRLRCGERWWGAEFVLRLSGIGLLGACYRFALLAHKLVIAPPPHQATLGEFGICAALFLTLTTGLALLCEGPGLFRLIPIPPRSLYF